MLVMVAASAARSGALPRCRKYMGPIICEQSWHIKVGMIRTYTIVREKDALDCDAFWKCHRILVLADLITLDILDGVEQPCPAVCTARSISYGQNIVPPTGTGDHGCALRTIHSVGYPKKCVDTDIICRCRDSDEGVT